MGGTAVGRSQSVDRVLKTCDLIGQPYPLAGERAQVRVDSLEGVGGSTVLQLPHHLDKAPD
jgi:hypothetical protein